MQYRTRKLVKASDLGAADTLFGGALLAWIDEEAAIYAMCQLGVQRLRTKIMGEADFLAPARCGDIVEIGVEVVAFGTTSITLRAEARNKNTRQTIIRLEKIVMVAVDEYGKKTEHGVTQERTE